MGSGLSRFLTDDSGSIAAEYALLIPLAGAALLLALGQVTYTLLNPQNRVAIKARVRRRGTRRRA